LSALGIAALVRDPPKPEGEPRGSLLDLLAMPALWPILIAMFVCYAPAAGRARPLDQPLRGRGPRRGPDPDRHRDAGHGPCHGGRQLRLRPHRPLARHRKGPILVGNLTVALLLLSLWLIPASGLTGAVILFALIGLFGASYPIVISHGRSFLPAHLTGRGVTLLNLFGMGGAGVMQFASGPVYAKSPKAAARRRPSARSSRSSRSSS
jgi:hypothetical protein